ncbi:MULTISPECIES: helix-turn-helix domain-containing protein [unclassified Methylobacterium]|uniref:helix-turn-helix domain-containing protein n=1 Tax=unclassified Methylobacterium TaxID=2615210 RepID=UPI0006FB7542|nr:MULTISPECIES: helix-turn-helix domain-containing protein [unclassified Methylobacterium]KQP50898.1 XRE family transcriptional regulator [Methylobacterium sp. Leaf108]KQT88994.1 XRE family transcriptional regulator [Methylobacterium sp. Leaf466]
MVRVTLAELAARPADVDQAKLDATTEEDIRRHMIEDGYDPDDPSYLEGAVVVRPPHRVRERLGLTQVEFARLIDAPLATLKNWEQGRTSVPPYVRVLLNILDREPEAALRALGRAPSIAA